MRAVQKCGDKGSLKWLQRAIAVYPELLQPLSVPTIRWVSPLAEDEFAEYRDAAFLEQIGQAGLRDSLKQFWPALGPQWDALGATERGPVLVEAKAHLAEFLTPATQASGKSKAQIEHAFAQVKAALGCTQGCDWATRFYQLANRIAYLWWLHQNDVQADLLFVSFVGDTEMNGPASPDIWEAAFEVANYALGLPKKHALRRFIHHVMPDVKLLQPSSCHAP